METLHRMLPEDEIFLCGVALLVGLVLGVMYGVVKVWRARRTA
jgi:hypothetical protein